MPPTSRQAAAQARPRRCRPGFAGPAPDFAALAASLAGHGLRTTAPRRALFALLAGHPQGITVAEAIVAMRDAGIGQATVYRTLGLFETIGIIYCVHGADGRHRFIPWRPGHMHALVCRVCGQAVEFDACGLQVLERLLASETGYEIEGHHVEVFGRCPACRTRAGGT
ncbi:MAG: Zinc-specific metallo-regulatory protein [Lentisphaerae bacterium ADurb.BinA184]|nr:MAG: Zinc-specific metallo-regulatory protein [Lentisphaerae bacterium ADurb.BinA184]